MAKKVKSPEPETLPAVPFKPSAKDEAAVAAYTALESERPIAAKIKTESQKGGKVTLTLSPASGVYAEDKDAFRVAGARLTKTFGEVDWDAAKHLLDHIIYGTATKSGVNDNAVNASLALVASIDPRDGTEAMLAVQMVNTHCLIAELQRRMMNMQQTVPLQDSNGGLLVRLLRTYTAQVETLKRYRTGGEQRVSVTHQHVTVNADKAAVAVNPLLANEPGVGMAEKTEEQPHERREVGLIAESNDILPGSFKANRQTLRKETR